MEIRPLRWNEIESFARSSSYAFDGRGVEQRLTDFGRRVDPERHCLVLVEDGVLVSHVMIYDFGIWIAGQRFPTGGLANVSTVPERARQGHASRLLRETLVWMRSELGMCLSTLYPTVFPLYAGLGWALAQDAARYVGPPNAFRPAPRLPADPGARVVRRRSSAEDIELLEPIYRRHAEPRTAYLDRPRWYWEDMVLRGGRDTPPPWLALWHDSNGRPGAYALYSLVENPQPLLNVHELISPVPEGYRDLLAFLSAHHLWDKIHLDGGGDVPWRSLLANPQHVEIETRTRHHFMLRVVDVPAAIALRSVDDTVSASDVYMRVLDDDAPWNDRIWRIGLPGGPDPRHWTCEGENVQTASAVVDIATFSALFAGFTSVRQALDLGTLRADATAIRTLDALFALPYRPHSLDHF